MPEILERGQKIISSQFGVGVILSIESLPGQNTPFYVVQSLKKNIKTFVPLDKSETIRPVSGRPGLREILKGLSAPIPSRSFSLKKDRVNYYKNRARINDIGEISLTLRELYSLDDRGKVEDVILENMIENLGLEITTAFNFDLQKSKNVIFQALKGEKYEL